MVIVGVILYLMMMFIDDVCWMMLLSINWFGWLVNSGFGVGNKIVD